MSTLPKVDSKVQLFGFDLGSFWHDLLSAWGAMARWPLFSWLRPKLPVRVLLPAGKLAVSGDLNSPPVHDEVGARSAKFEALVLPESLLLRRTLVLPKLESAEISAALSLEAQRLSPFAAEDLAWTYEIGPHGNGPEQIGLILCSRKLIARELDLVRPGLRSREPEIWVARLRGPGFVMLSGFGEARRQRLGEFWHWVGIVMAMLVFALLAALAMTPTIKLHLLSRQAMQAMTTLQQKASPVIAQRETLVRTGEQLAALAALAGTPLPPLQTLKLITETLPDDTSLFNLQVRGLNVSITGQTGNAAALMKQLGATPGLRDVKAPTPATKPLGAPRESFTIEFTLDPAQLKPAS